MADDRQLQIIVSIPAENQKFIKQRSVGNLHRFSFRMELPSSVMLRASRVVVRVADSDVKVTRSPSLEEIAKLPLPSYVEAAATSHGSVEGLVTFRGKPIPGTVWFNTPGSLPTAAVIDETGKFLIDSLKPGKYKLTIDAEAASAAKEIPAKYKTAEITPIEFEVSVGKNAFDIELTNPFTTTNDR